MLPDDCRGVGPGRSVQLCQSDEVFNQRRKLAGSIALNGMTRSIHDGDPHSWLAAAELSDILVGDKDRVTAEDEHHRYRNIRNILPESREVAPLRRWWVTRVTEKVIAPGPTSIGQGHGVVPHPSSYG